MATKKTNKKTVTNVSRNTQEQVINTASLMRAAALQRLLFPERNINYECQYPNEISITDYKDLYQREGIAKRVVSIYPQYCWQQMPWIYETEDPTETEFEKALKLLERERQLLHYLHRVDVMSGIGQYGVLLLGVSDGQPLDQPLPHINEITGEVVGGAPLKLLYLKPFDQASIAIKTKENDPTSPRFGLPKTYEISFEDITTLNSTGGTTTKTQKIHWTRILHVADNREESEVLGKPRMKDVYNRLVDVTQKLLPGSAEMFWKGGYPGFGFEAPTGGDVEVEIDNDAIRDQMQAYSNGLQRYMAMENLVIKQLSPQIADPRGHFEVQLEAIAISLGVPKRILMGSEMAKLASIQDEGNWNDQIVARRTNYVDPMLVRPFMDRLIAFGVLPEPKEYFVEWPSIDTPTDDDKATVAVKRTEALAKYVGGSVDAIIPPEEYMTHVLEMDPEVIDQIMTASEKYVSDFQKEQDATQQTDDNTIDGQAGE